MIPVIANPAPTRIPDNIRGTLELNLLLSKLPKNAPRQKKHMVTVKLKASAESLHPYTSLNGTFSIDHAYSIPEKSILSIPIVR